MGKWFDQAREIEQLRRENARLTALVKHLKTETGVSTDVNEYGVSAGERNLAAAGEQIQAIKKYRERTGADLRTAKDAIDSVS